MGKRCCFGNLLWRQHCRQFTFGLHWGEILGQQTDFQGWPLRQPVQNGLCTAVEMAGHQQMAHNHPLLCLDQPVKTTGHDGPIIRHPADAFATALRAGRWPKFEIGQVNVNGAIQ